VTAPFLPLERLLATGRPGGWPVAFRGRQSLDWAAFAGHVGALREMLQPAGGRWALFTTDAYAFAVGLMAIWQADGVAVVAPNGQPGALAATAASADGLVSDVTAVPGVRVEPVLREGGWRSWTPRVLDRQAERLELSTSGTSGDRRRVLKRVAQLADEVCGLERQWGAALAGRQVLATVSQQHIYGLLFRVLWPLCAGRTFHADTTLYPDEIRAALPDGVTGCLVTTPAHLRRLTDMQGTAGLASVCRPLFSSGGPLDAATAIRLADTVGCAPVEVFGSTETGGVAWRQQGKDPASSAWQPFEGVQVSLDASGLLRVRSPHAGDDQPVTMADRADVQDGGRFILQGRSDRVVKIGGKRLSLPEMEQRLLEHDDVAEVALTAVPSRGESRVAAAVVLAPAGWARLAAVGRRGVIAGLTAHLAPYWDRVLLPRLWRFVERLPEDEQGKLASAAVAALFETDREDRPQVLAESVTATTCRRRWRVPERLGWCDGHFPDLPIVPGFVQLDWILDAARSLVDGPVSLAAIEAAKFREPLRPGDVVELEAEWVPATGWLAYRVSRDGGRVLASGRCRLEAPRA
jgi:acyl-CoA synthetase (AMP-forming)/AMP-acid ligase II